MISGPDLRALHAAFARARRREQILAACRVLSDPAGREAAAAAAALAS